MVWECGNACGRGGKVFLHLLGMSWIYGAVLAGLWCGEQPLKPSYLKLFSIARCEDAWVADHMQFQNGNIYWNILFTRLVLFAFFELCSQRVR